MAATKAIGGILENAPKFDPNEGEIDEFVKKEEPTDDEPPEVAAPHGEDQLNLDTLDVSTIIRKGKPLLGSAGREYDCKLAGMSPTDRLAFRKRNLTSRLGLKGEYINDDLISEHDVDSPKVVTSSAPSHSAIASPTETETGTPGEQNLSKRQLAMMRRRRKRPMENGGPEATVDFSVPKPTVVPSPAPEVKKEVKNEISEAFSLDRTNMDDDSKLVTEFKGAPIEEKPSFLEQTEEERVDWPFDKLCDILLVDLFDPSWEVRHGAAMCLREVVKTHGAGAGRKIGRSRNENDVSNQRWLDDLACRLCAVFMLDRFGDYVSDSVVVPVRETAGQCLGAVLQYMSPSQVRKTYSILRKLVVPTELMNGHAENGLSWAERAWQPCHGGMLGLRYLVAVRADLLIKHPDLLESVLSTVMIGLGDADDDVRAVSAATLIPIAKEVVTTRMSSLGELVSIVWDCLSNLGDDLSASTGFMMDLLAKLCGFPQILEAMKQNAIADPSKSFEELVPRLYPFLRHTITTVRLAVLRALITFLNMNSVEARAWINGKAMRLIFQNLLVERNEGVLSKSLELWNKILDFTVTTDNVEFFVNEFASHVEPLIKLTVTPVGVSRHPIPMNSNLFLRPSGSTYNIPTTISQPVSSPTRPTEPPKKRRKSEKKVEKEVAIAPHIVDAPIMSGDVDLVGANVFIRCRITAARAFGRAISLWPVESRLNTFSKWLAADVVSPHSSTRVFSCIIIEEYARALGNSGQPDQDDPLLSYLKDYLYSLIFDELPAYYRDIKSYMYIVRAQCQSMINAFREAGCNPSHLPSIAPVVQGDENANHYAFGISSAMQIVNDDYERLKKCLTPAERVACLSMIDDARQSALSAIEEARSIKDSRDVRVKAIAGGAIVAASILPAKPAMVIKGIMDGVKSEENGDLQHRFAVSVAHLVRMVQRNGKKVIAEKVINNLIQFACMETAETPEFIPNMNIESGILSLRKEEDIKEHQDAAKYEMEARRARITRRGAKDGLEQIVILYGPSLFDELPIMRSHIEGPIHEVFGIDSLPEEIGVPEKNPLGQRAIDALSTLRALVPTFHSDLHSFVTDLYPHISRALHCPLAVLRYAAAKCFATICSVMTVSGITTLVEVILPNLNNPTDVRYRQGAIECVYHLLHVMEDRILPYVIFLIVPLLGRMSDSDKDVRLIATTAFATLVKLVPLEAGIPDPPGLSEKLLLGRERERKFMAQMLDAKKVEPFQIPVAIKAELRSYQQDGVNWLAFLNRYHLHGILCDDMGLGKTLQTICIVASDHHLRAEEYEKTQNPDVRRLPSLIVCPPTLSGHWQQEIKTYAPFLSTVAYVGPPSERNKLRTRLMSTDIVITSYDICRNDNDFLSPLNWNYCVLDEGHLIKNPQTKTTIAVKNLASNHRLILSGTPIQNNVLELWSLFDFLMPGFLGSEKIFQDRFAKPIAASRNAKSSSKEQEAGALAIEGLHKQVLPFLLRRLKEEVLDDLPPKIIQNYYCDLSDLQRKLFEDFSRKEGKAIAERAGNQDKESKQHIFHALQYMRKLCNSPAFVMKETHKAYEPTQQYLARHGTSLSDPAHAPKLRALKDLLLDCGIGVGGGGQGNIASNQHDIIQGAVSQHRALIFCQMKEMLDMVQEQVLKKMLPSVTYMRLDGSVEANRRQQIVNQFNSDPSYDVLLLTTSVGGLGLNLTGADTVIFVEHDWNPQKDMQAMDRAHRIGQKKVVNVYRIVTRGTLEEKILSLQRFKLDVASTVVNQQNAGLATMETDQILDLFNVSSASSEEQAPALPPVDKDSMDISEDNAVDSTGAIRRDGKRGFLDDLGELWDDSQYEEEFNIDNFLERMKM